MPSASQGWHSSHWNTPGLISLQTLPWLLPVITDMLFFCTGHTGTQHFSTTKAWLHDLVWPMKCSQKCCVLHLTFDSLHALPLQHVYLWRCRKIKQPGTKSQCLQSSYCEELPEPSPNFVTLCEWDINFCCVKPLVGVVCYHSIK